MLTCTKKVGFTVSGDGLQEWFNKTRGMLDIDTELEKMEVGVRAIRETHFMPQGVMQRITEFLKSDGQLDGDLICQKLPADWGS